MGKPKSMTAVMAALKEELEAENPEQVLEIVRGMAIAGQSVDNLGPLAVTLCLGRTGSLRYSHAVIGVVGLEDLLRIQDATRHFLREVLGSGIKHLEIDAEVQRRLGEPNRGEN